MTVNLTINYAFRLPVPGTEIDVWGALLNSNWTDIDVDLKAVSDAAVAAQATATAGQATANAALPKAGGTMTGAIVLSGLPVASTQAANKQYVDNIGMATGGYWLWDDSNVMGDPGAGNMRADGATGNVTTQFAISVTRSDGGTLPSAIFRVNDGINIRISASSFGRFVITSAVFNATWWLITATYVGSTGNGNPATGAVAGLRIDAYYVQPAASVTNAMLSTMATLTIKGNNTGATGAPLDLTAAQVTGMLNVAAASLKGLVPAPSAAPVATKYLAENMTYVTLPSFAYTEYDKGALANSTSYIQAHGAVSYPKGFDVWFQCTTVDNGYAVGDRIKANYMMSNNSDNFGTAYTEGAGGNVGYRVGTAGNFRVNNKTGTSVGINTFSNWKVIFGVTI